MYVSHKNQRPHEIVVLEDRRYGESHQSARFTNSLDATLLADFFPVS